MVNAPVVISHETGHLIGFDDRYTEIGPNHVGFRQYLMGKYGKEPGGKAYQMIQFLDKNKISGECLSDVGFENNHMNNNNGELTDGQIESLVNTALKAANGASETEINGIFDRDSKGGPTQDQIQGAYEQMDKRTNDLMQQAQNEKK